VGQPPFQTDRIYDTTPPGVVTGLAWTSMGGSTLYIECTAIATSSSSSSSSSSEGGDKKKGGGGGTLLTTGQLGDVMRESTTIAHTYAKSFMCRHFPENAFLDDMAGGLMLLTTSPWPTLHLLHLLCAHV
jgi:Lon-like ATP-dependent protease